METGDRCKLPDGYIHITGVKLPEYSPWKCHPFGFDGGYVLVPRNGMEPNRFHRWMQKLFFGFTWIKDK